MTTPIIDRIMILSTGHLSPELASALDPSFPPRLPNGDPYPRAKIDQLCYDVISYGWLVWVPEDKDILNDMAKDDAVMGRILAYASQHGCRYIRFDSDALANDDLPTYDW